MTHHLEFCIERCLREIFWCFPFFYTHFLYDIEIKVADTYGFVEKHLCNECSRKTGIYE